MSPSPFLPTLIDRVMGLAKLIDERMVGLEATLPGPIFRDTPGYEPMYEYVGDELTDAEDDA